MGRDLFGGPLTHMFANGCQTVIQGQGCFTKCESPLRDTNCSVKGVLVTFSNFDLVSCGNNFLTCGNNLLSCGNDFLTCGNDLASCGNNLPTCGNNYLVGMTF